VIVLLVVAAFLVGLGFGLFIGQSRSRPMERQAYTDARLRKLNVIDPLLNGPERQHVTLGPRHPSQQHPSVRRHDR